jgi:hypothetical protein
MTGSRPTRTAAFGLVAFAIAAAWALAPAAAGAADQGAGQPATQAAEPVGQIQQVPQVPIEPARNILLKDTPNDAGTSIDINWDLSHTEATAPGTVVDYKIMRADAPDGEFAEVGSVPAATPTFTDGTTQTGKQYWYRVDAVGTSAPAPSSVSGPAVSVMQWFNGRYMVLALVVFICAAVLAYISIARRKMGQVFVRRIPALDAVDEAIGRATEMGKSVLYVAGGLDIDDPQTIASMNILSRVAERIATYGTRLVMPCCRAMVMSMARETVKESYLRVGKPDDYKEENIRYLTDDQFGYVAGVDGIMMRERPAANFYLGAFYAESLILAETGFSTGAIQIAGTAMIDQLPFFVTACDYTLIGEELYAAGASLSGDPVQLGTIKGQDVAKALFLGFIVVGVVLSLMGIEWFNALFVLQ